mgnify:FL=1
MVALASNVNKVPSHAGIVPEVNPIERVGVVVLEQMLMLSTAKLDREPEPLMSLCAHLK